MSTTKHELHTLKGYDTTVPLAPNSPRVGTLCRPFPQATPTRPKDYLGQSSPALASYRDTHQPCTPFSLPQPIPRFTPNPARNPQPRPIASLSLFWPAKFRPGWQRSGYTTFQQFQPLSNYLPSIGRSRSELPSTYRKSTQSRRKFSKRFSPANSVYWN